MSVALVGAGPGDPGLITVRGRQLLAEADCVIHDYLVSPAILGLIPAGIAVHNVGKRGHAESVSQTQINDLLVDCARRHQRVVRLKGGDPFVFGRGGEEVQALRAAGIACCVVPGVTSGIAVPAYAGIPVTHRASSSAVAFVTGHQQAGADWPLDWAAFAKVETLVLYMGMQRLADNCAALIAHGRSPDTPAAAIQWGTYARQRTVTGTLATLPGLVAAAGLGAPAITVVGDVVRFRDDIAWFERRPLHGRRVLVTRDAKDQGRIAAWLDEAGAEVVACPLQRIHPLPITLPPLAGIDWIAVASANAADALCAGVRDARALAGPRIAAVGPGTAERLRTHGIVADLQPERSDADSLAQAMIAAGGRSALVPQSEEARPELAAALRSADWSVTTLVAYRVEPLVVDAARLGHLDAITVASAATARRLAAAMPDLAARRAAGCRVVAMGPRTAAACTELGLPADVVADEPTPAALGAAVIRSLT